MKKKLFAVSDIHGHAAVLKKALSDAGFDASDPSHLFVCCGDCFDRGTENREVLSYLLSLPHKVLIRGNHEDMLSEDLRRGRMGVFDPHNGTDITLREFFGAVDASGFFRAEGEICDELSRLYSCMVDYFETPRYVFTHGWLPLIYGERIPSLDPSFRVATLSGWENARCLEWQQTYPAGLLLGDRTIVCGHRASRLGYSFDPERLPGDDSIFRGDGMIAIDSCTVRSGEIHVLLAEEDVPEPTIHTMRLLSRPFSQIKEGRKTVEMRLYDEKRQRLRPLNRIRFVSEDGETLMAEVTGLYRYPDFVSLSREFLPSELGADGLTPEQIADAMCLIYPKEDIFTYGAFAIRLRVIDAGK